MAEITLDKTELDKPLDPRLISNRKGGGNATLKYIEGHDAIDQANRLFGYGNWGYHPLFCTQEVLVDPVTGEPLGVAYKAQVELTVQGCQSITDVGSQPVTSWNVVDVVMSRRKKGDAAPIQDWERVNARRTILESHEMAEKGAVTDALKRALRAFGNQFGNGLYGDGRVDVDSPVASHNDASGASTHRDSATHAATPTNTVSSLQRMIDIATARAEKIGKTWVAIKAEALGKVVQDSEIVVSDFTKINGLLTKLEKGQAA